MINFVSTFPPLICGVGAYTKYLVTHMPKDCWCVTSFRLSEFLEAKEAVPEDGKVNYTITLKEPHLPLSEDVAVVWFEHAFGMWGKDSSSFLHLIKEAKKKGKKVVVSFHTIHFQSLETPSGMEEKEYGLLEETLPLVDGVTVFSKGAEEAVLKAFPQFREKIALIRHGVHLYSAIKKEEARRKLLKYLIEEAKISVKKKEELKRMTPLLLSEESILIGNFGFITKDKDPLVLYKLRHLLQDRLPQYEVVALYIGIIQRRKDKDAEKNLPILRQLQSVHDGERNLFYQEYINEQILPFAFKALDFVVFWPFNATQSGRMAHAQGAGACVVGKDIEGVGETLKMAQLPAASSLEELAEGMQKIILDKKLAEHLQRESLRYAQRFSYKEQAKKHLLLASSLQYKKEVPVLDQ